MSTIAVREAAPGDARAIAEVHVRAWQDGYRGQLPDAYLDEMSEHLDARMQRWRRGLETEQAQKTWVGILDEEIVGIATAGPARDEDHRGGELWMLNVIGRAWGAGVGRALLGTATEHLRRSGFAEATLWVLDSNERARRFYERNGWIPDGATQDDEERGFTLREVRYRVDL